MPYKYTFDPIAADEYEEAFNWYEEKSVMAADNLILAVQNALTAICAEPTRYRNTYKDLRELALKKYPYSLIYLIDEENKIVTITSVFHHKRNPKRKFDKSKLTKN